MNKAKKSLSGDDLVTEGLTETLFYEHATLDTLGLGRITKNQK